MTMGPLLAEAIGPMIADLYSDGVEMSELMPKGWERFFTMSYVCWIQRLYFERIITPGVKALIEAQGEGGGR